MVTGREWEIAKKYINKYLEWCEDTNRIPYFGEMFSVACVNLLEEETFTRDKRIELYKLMEEEYVMEKDG